MADQPGEEDELLLTNQVEDEDDPVAADAVDQPDDDEGDEPETIITFGDEEAPSSDEADAPQWVREVRKQNRELQREIAELKRSAAPVVAVIEVGPEPKFDDEGTDWYYDQDAWKSEWLKWNERKIEADKANESARTKAEQSQAAWQAELQEYGNKRAALRIPDFQDAEDEVLTHLSKNQQAIIVRGAENSPAVIYALGKHSAKLKAISSIEDPVKFAFAVARLERELKVTTKRKAPEPEGVVRGSAPMAAGADKARERLERDADRTGDRTALIKYDRDRRQAAN